MSHNPSSEGQRQLVELKLSQRRVAEAIGVTHSTVQRWASGIKVPGHEHRQKLAELFGIPPSSWESAPLAEPPAAVMAQQLRAEADARVIADTIAEPLPSAAEQLEALATQCREARAGNPAPSVLARLAALEIRAVEAREKLRSAVEVAARDPETQAWVLELCGQIAAHPLAAIQLARNALVASAPPARVEQWDAAHARWRERHAALVEAAEQANAALLAVLPRGASFEASK
jgi:transcriptional regulator with XRE-family HTH domain